MKITTTLVHPVAEAILAILSTYEVEENPDVLVHLESAAFYNGRERGVAVIVHNFALNGNPYAITFGECRNSDSIFVDEFEYGSGINPPTVHDLSDEAYAKRKYFSYDGVVKAAEYVFDRIQNRMQKLQKSAKPKSKAESEG